MSAPVCVSKQLAPPALAYISASFCVDLATSIKHCTAKLQSLIAQSRLTVSGSAAGQVLLLPKGESLSFPSVKRTVMIYYYTQPYKNYIIILSTKINLPVLFFSKL